MKIIECTTPELKKKFVQFPYELYAQEKNWVPPLQMELEDRINPKKNPYFEYARARFFLAFEGDKIVGRISSQINEQYNKFHHDKTGHFGFFDCIDDARVAEALLDTARKALREEGMQEMQGPYSLSINEECGVLVEGFEKPSFPYTPYNFSYYNTLLEENGLKKVKDMIGWIYDSARPIPEGAQQIAEYVRTLPNVVVREIRLNDMENEMRVVSEVFNSAWSKNWGFIPWTKSELKKSAKDLKMILEPKLALIAEVDGKPAAISIALPNYHEIIADLKGKLFPFGIFKFLFRLKTNKIKSARMILLGLKKEYRNDVLSGLSVLLYSEMHRRSQVLGHWGGEISWTLEDNVKINNGIALMGGVPYKKFRMYQQTL